MNPLARALVFSKTSGYRHDSIPEGVRGVRELLEARGFEVDATEDAAAFSPARLAALDVVVFLNTSGNVLDPEHQTAVETFVRAGGGFAGIHCASCTEYEWPFYRRLVGALFTAHPEVQSAQVRVEDAAHPSTAELPACFDWVDEWYAFDENPRPRVRVLLSVDETTYRAGDGAMGADHPIAWCHEVDRGRSFYTALGHRAESYFDPLLVAHLAGGIAWAARRA